MLYTVVYKYKFNLKWNWNWNCVCHIHLHIFDFHDSSECAFTECSHNFICNDKSKRKQNNELINVHINFWDFFLIWFAVFIWFSLLSGNVSDITRIEILVYFRRFRKSMEFRYIGNNYRNISLSFWSSLMELN